MTKGKFEKLKDYLINLFADRFGYDITVNFEYIKPKETRKQRLPAF